MPKSKVKEPKPMYVAATDEPQADTEADGAGEIKFRNAIDAHGWAKISHLLTTDVRLSDGAFRTYVLLVKYAQQHEKLWAGVERLSEARGVSTRTLTTHLSELESLGFITRHRRLGKTSLTFIEDLASIYNLDAQ